LSGAARLYLDLLQLVRTAHGSGFDPTLAAKGFAARLAGVAGMSSVSELNARLEGLSTEVRTRFETLLGPLN
jgi:glutamate-ammonia-ligase adenylyltransferase